MIRGTSIVEEEPGGELITSVWLFAREDDCTIYDVHSSDYHEQAYDYNKNI